MPRESVDRYVNGLTSISDYEKRKLRETLDGLDWDKPFNELRDELVFILQAYAREAAGMASTYSASFYDELRQLMVGQTLGALASDRYADPARIEGAVRAMVDPLAKADHNDLQSVESAVETVKGSMSERLGYEVRRAAGETLYDNGRRDPKKPRYARIPRGSRSYPNGCPFCQMLASRGFAYLSELSAGGMDTSHYHDDCRCAILPSWDRSPEVEGYDPKRYEEGYSEWREADHSRHDEMVTARKHGARASISERVEANLSEEGWTNDIDRREAESVAHAINTVYHRRFGSKGRHQFAHGDYVYSIEVHGFYSYTFFAKRKIK